MAVPPETVARVLTSIGVEALRFLGAGIGSAVERIIHFYRVWYATVYAHTKPFDPLTYGWCLASLRRTLGQ